MRTKEEYFKKEKEIIGTTTVDFDGPVIVGGKGVWAYDLDGRKILDFTGQISLLNTGYGSKEVASALRQQIKSGVHSCISADYPYLSEIIINRKRMEVSRVALAEKLIKITDKVMPFPKRVFFEVTGALGVNLAAKIAKITHLKNRGVKIKDFNALFEKDIFIPSQEKLCKFSFLVFRNAFHGRPGDPQCFTNSKARQLWGASSSCAVGRLPFPLPAVDAADLIATVDKIIEKLSQFAPIVAFIFEPIQGEGGINIPNGILLKTLVNYLRNRRIYIIADEVQTGFGRTGKMFACEHFGIEPDTMVLSKSLGAGIPMAAVIVNADKFPDLEPGMHSGSHHATPLACAGAIANIDKIIREDLVAQSENYGAYALNRLQTTLKGYPEIVDVRGLGLMIGIEFASAEIRDEVAKDCKKNGLLLASASAKTIRMTPALVVSIPEIDIAVQIFKKSFLDVVFRHSN